MCSVRLEIKNRNRQYGIITWPLKQDFEIKTLLTNSKFINLEFNGKLYSNKKVDYKYRRMSFGKKRMEYFKNHDFLVLRKKGNRIVLSKD